MKHIIQLHYLLLSILFYSINSPCSSKNIPMEAKTLSYSWPSGEFFPTQDHYQEGFSTNTLIQTPFGYKEIETLTENDIVIDCNGEKKKILAITKNFVDKYIKLVVNDAAIYTGCDQLYYLYPDTWTPARDIKEGDMLFGNINNGCLAIEVELIHENRWIYYLTVEDHTFCISPYDLCVHNAASAFIGVSSICVGSITIINPIAATIGATIALSAIAHLAAQAYMKQCPESDENTTLPTNVMLAERSYYVQRLCDLDAIKQELYHIKNDLENIKVFCGGNSASFSYQFLKQINIQNIHNQSLLLKISAEREIKLSNKEKEDLRTLREIELQCLEQEIINLHVALAFHLNELINQVNDADNECKKAKKEIDIVTDLWNKNLYRMTDSIALQSYKADLLDEHLLNNFKQKVYELKIVIHHYRNCMHTTCIQQSTNILDILEKMSPVIAEYEQRIAKDLIRIAQNITIVESYFTCRNTPIIHIKNETKNYLENSRNKRNAQAIAEAKNKLNSIVVAGSPQSNNKKNDDNEDDDHKDSSNKEKSFKTTKEATEAAEKLGFKKTNYQSSGQPVFKKGNRYISPDRDSHNGGVWKMADSVKNLGSRTTRMGTYDKFLNRIGN